MFELTATDSTVEEVQVEEEQLILIPLWLRVTRLLLSCLTPPPVFMSMMTILPLQVQLLTITVIWRIPWLPQRINTSSSSSSSSKWAPLLLSTV